MHLEAPPIDLVRPMPSTLHCHPPQPLRRQRNAHTLGNVNNFRLRERHIALTPIKPPKAKTAMKRPAAAIEYWDGKTQPTCRKIGDMPFMYKRSKIYVSAPKKCFRVILEASNYSTEKQMGWDGDKPNASVWIEALKQCDDHAAKHA